MSEKDVVENVDSPGEIAIPIADNSTPGIASFDSNDFTVGTDGKVSSIVERGIPQYLGKITGTGTGTTDLNWEVDTNTVKKNKLIKLGEYIMLTERFNQFVPGDIFRITNVQIEGSKYTVKTNNVRALSLASIVGPQGEQGDEGPQGVPYLAYTDSIESTADPVPDSIMHLEDGHFNRTPIINVGEYQDVVTLDWYNKTTHRAFMVTGYIQSKDGATNQWVALITAVTDITGAGIADIVDIDYPHGEFTSVQYDTTDGIKMRGIAKYLRDDGETYQIPTGIDVPLVAGAGILIDKKNTEEKVEIKSLNSNLENGTGDVLIQTTDTNRSFKVMKDGRAKVQSTPVEDDDVVRKKELDKEIATLNGDLVDYLDVSHINLDDSTILLDGYIDKNGDVQTSLNWKHTTPILINKNFLAKIKCRTEINIAVISQTDAEGNEYTPIIIGSDPSINTFDYNPNADTYVSICFPPVYPHKLTVIGNYESRITSLERNVDLLNDSTAVEKDVDILTEATKHENYFINAKTGAITAISSSARYFYTDNISVKAGDVITVYGKDDSGTVVATLSRWTSNGTFISTLLYGNQTMSTRTYTVTEDMYIRVCGQQSTGEDGIKSVTNHTIIIPDVFKKSVNSIIPEPIYLDISMFKTMGVCGDSYTSGAIYVGDTLVGEITESSWGKVLERMHGIDVTIYAQGGSDTNNYQTRQTCLPKILTDNAKDCYVLALGINDQLSVTLGTIADIHDDYTENPNTFYGNYGRIIAQIKAHAPNAALIISKVFIPTFSNAAYYNYSSAAIEEIASKFNIPFIETADSDFLSSSWYNSNIVHGHPTAPLYSGIAKAMADLISKSLYKNISYFQTKYNQQNS